MSTAITSGPSSISVLTAVVLATSFLIGLNQYNSSHSPVANIPSLQSSVPQAPTQETESPQPAPEISYAITPGKSFGNITENTSEDDLRELFGSENVQTGDIYLGEGESEKGTIVFPNDTEKRLEVIWQDSKTHLHPAFIQISGTHCLWQLPSGISLGTSLAELESKNGKSFNLYGFNWDYGGTITSWNNGTLKNFESIVIRLAYPEKPSISSEELDTVVGSQEFVSSIPVLHALNPKIGFIRFSFLKSPPKIAETKPPETSQTPAPSVPVEAPKPVATESSVPLPTPTAMDIKIDTNSGPQLPRLDFEDSLRKPSVSPGSSETIEMPSSPQY